MAEVVSIVLAGEPRGKGRGRVGRLADGRPTIFTPAETRKYETALRVAATQAMAGRTLLEGPIRVEVVATMPVPLSWSGVQRRAALWGNRRPTSKPDVDNILKILDALNQVVWADDRQIVEAVCVKRYGAQPGLAITAWELIAVQPVPAPKPVDDLPLLAAG